MKELEQRVNPNPSGRESEAVEAGKKGPLSNKAMRKVLGVVLAVGIFGGGVGVANYLNNKPAVVAENPGDPGEKPQAIPAEAKGFVSDFGDRYADPVSTYYSVLGYGKIYNRTGELAVRTIIMPDTYVDGFESANPSQGEVSPIGFNYGTMPINAKMNQKLSMEIFNKWEAPNMNRYMNMIAKNPSKEAVTLIDNQFMMYCANKDFNPTVSTDNAEEEARAERLISTMKAVVAEFGSNANYSIAPAAAVSIKYPDTKTTDFDVDTPTTLKEDNAGFYDNGINILINVDVYNGAKVTHVRKILKSVQLEVRKGLVYVEGAKLINIYFGQDDATWVYK